MGDMAWSIFGGFCLVVGGAFGVYWAGRSGRSRYRGCMAGVAVGFLAGSLIYYAVIQFAAH